ncbi:hypothetical protein NEDG_01055 [Nematocida displodere]|uniref:Uncharacterized protein n=1 Tax=Nematocida displodere TaxID=1805483 RepID=A0A177EB15_9MICR|nr:hypothetical protein NEDG_01055 [Nematocida displodere]
MLVFKGRAQNTRQTTYSGGPLLKAVVAAFGEIEAECLQITNFPLSKCSLFHTAQVCKCSWVEHEPVKVDIRALEMVNMSHCAMSWVLATYQFQNTLSLTVADSMTKSLLFLDKLNCAHLLHLTLQALPRLRSLQCAPLMSGRVVASLVIEGIPKNVQAPRLLLRRIAANMGISLTAPLCFCLLLLGHSRCEAFTWKVTGVTHSELKRDLTEMKSVQFTKNISVANITLVLDPEEVHSPPLLNTMLWWLGKRFKALQAVGIQHTQKNDTLDRYIENAEFRLPGLSTVKQLRVQEKVLCMQRSEEVIEIGRLPIDRFGEWTSNRLWGSLPPDKSAFVVFKALQSKCRDTYRCIRCIATADSYGKRAHPLLHLQVPTLLLRRLSARVAHRGAYRALLCLSHMPSVLQLCPDVHCCEF